MKKLILGLVFAISCASVGIIYAQSLPVSKTLCWDQNPINEGVTLYTVTINGSATTVPNVVDPRAGNTILGVCMDFLITQLGALNISITGTNEFGTSDPSTLTRNVTIPGKSQNLRIK